jgi:hypothetical protein
MTSQMPAHGVRAVLPDAEEARLLMDHLEDVGVPADAISLLSAHAEEHRSEELETDREVDAVGELGRSVLVWALGGLIIGALVGWLITVALDDWSVLAGLLLGAVFGAALGGAAGGMSVAKYASTERANTFLAEGEGMVAVQVSHEDHAVIETATSILQEHPAVRVTRF